MADYKDFGSFDKVLDETFGESGTDTRSEFDLGIELWLVGRKIKEIRESKHLTQEDLGNLIGVQKAQISKIENGRNITIATVVKIFKALECNVKLQIEESGLSIAMG